MRQGAWCDLSKESRSVFGFDAIQPRPGLVGPSGARRGVNTHGRLQRRTRRGKWSGAVEAPTRAYKPSDSIPRRTIEGATAAWRRLAVVCALLAGLGRQLWWTTRLGLGKEGFFERQCTRIRIHTAETRRCTPRFSPRCRAATQSFVQGSRIGPGSHGSGGLGQGASAASCVV
ncbi:hypothetical protein BU23DRAFT_250318 [Bimuria novae-zelandiae CBS 107.79]|uniref:Uncharacterized protein n=1 Tax=Bimuria novae-zelandiae CBS 107.79 TaxID=1447943 RepID=A0A6A5VLC7_9PLEO|nr:hypothetical protein BU23DRAFT_250318 [Bimuria novae-zelandiae CBS 107.79]